MREEAGKGAERRRKCTLCGWQQAITVAQHLNLLPEPHFLECAGITQKMVAVQFQLWRGVIVLFNSQNTCILLLEKLKGLDL